VESGEEEGAFDEADDEMAGDVAAFGVADFMGQDGEEFVLRVGFDQGVVEGDAFGFAEAGEEGVGFGGAAGAVDDGDVSDREVALAGEG
jgi:hypothetical protein